MKIEFGKLYIDDHSELTNLPWSVAGHTIDIDIDFGDFDILNVGNIGVGTATPFIDFASASGDFTGGEQGIHINALTDPGAILIEGDGASLYLGDRLGDNNDKIFQWEVNSGLLTGRSLNDDLTILKDNVFVVDLATGFVGFGIVPTQQLHSFGPASIRALFERSTDTNVVTQYKSTAGSMFIGVTEDNLIISSNNDLINGNLTIFTQEGNVGINEPAPQDKLEVNGTVLVKDKLIFTQDDRNEYIDSEADGELDIAATTAIDFNIGGANDMRLNANSLDMKESVITNLSGLHFNSASELTISAGAVTLTQGHHSIDNEADATNDDLDTMNGGNAGEVLFILPANDARTVRIRNGVGNIFLKHQVVNKSFNFSSPSGSSGTFYSGGYYNWSSTDANLTQASLSVTHSAANSPSACHIGIVAGGAGVVDTGVVALAVNGTAIDDNGVRTASTVSVLSADITNLSTDQYIETPEKFIGQVTIILVVVSGSPVNFNLDINYGCSKYEDFSNQAFTVTTLECVGRAGASDTGFNLRLFHHSAANWTYAASGFVPGGTVLANMNTDYSTEQDLANGESFAYKRIDLNTDISGDNGEGLVLEITTSANKSVESMDIHFEVHTAPNFAYLATTKQHLIFMKHGANWLEL